MGLGYPVVSLDGEADDTFGTADLGDLDFSAHLDTLPSGEQVVGPNAQGIGAILHRSEGIRHFPGNGIAERNLAS